MTEKYSQLIDDSLQRAKIALKSGHQSQCLFQLAAILWENPEQKEALDIFNGCGDTIEILWPSFDVQRKFLISLLNARHGRLREAIMQLFQLLDEHPSEPRYQLAARWFKELSATETVSESEIARMFFVHLSAIIYAYPGVLCEDLTSRARIKTASPLIDAALECFKEPKSIWLTYILGSSVLRKAGEFERAILFAQRALEMEPGEYDSMLTLANAYRAQNDTEQCLKWLGKAAKTAPNNAASATITRDQALTLEEGHRDHEALTAFENLLTSSPENYPWKLLIAHLRRRLLLPFDPDFEEPLSRVEPGANFDRLWNALHSPWIGHLPDPYSPAIESFTNALAKIETEAEIEAEMKRICSVTILGKLAPAPSAIKALQLLQPSIRVRAEETQTHCRLPAGLALWHQRWEAEEDGGWHLADLRPAFPKPPTHLVEAIEALANAPFDVQRCFEETQKMTREISPSVEELLGCMCHFRPAVNKNPHPSLKAWSWVHRLQVVSALALAHINGGQQTLRRLILGPHDWAIIAGVVGLVEASLHQPKILASTHSLLWSLTSVARRETNCWKHSFAAVALRLPGWTSHQRKMIGSLNDKEEKNNA